MKGLKGNLGQTLADEVLSAILGEPQEVNT